MSRQGNPKTQQGRQESRQTRYLQANQEPRVMKEYRSMRPAAGPSQFDLSSHLQSPNWPKIHKGIEQQLAKIYTNNKLALKHEHWVLKPDRTPDEEGIRSRRLLNITPADWDKQIAFWLDPKNLARAVQNAQNRAKSMMESSATREYPFLIQTYFDTHTVDGGFLQDEERLLYEEMLRLKDLGPNTTSGQARDVLAIPEPRCTHTTDVDESQHEVGSDIGSGEDGDDEPGEDEDTGEDEDVDEDVDS
ncbi:hypothetical protein Tco_0026566 [Tanacetum coccineum]